MQQDFKQQQPSHQQQQSHHNQIKDFSNHFPPVQISSKHYSLDADIMTGWKPKIKILGPIPLNFDFKVVDEIIDQLTSFGRKYKERVIYLGHRFQSSFKMHQQIKRNYDFKYQGVINSNYLHMAAYFRKFHANFKSKSSRIFKGMNPTIQKSSQLLFDSNFQSGNLDVVIKTSQNQYDLFMRIDSNTRGHNQWYNFTIKNNNQKRIKLNIVNFKKSKTMYTRGMKPYVYSNFLKQTTQVGWAQGGQNVRFTKKMFAYEFLQQYFTDDQITYNCLSFEYQFNTDWQQVQFAYAPPYTYTNMNQMIKSLRILNRSLMLSSNSSQIFIKQQVLCESLGGLDLPLLTITDPLIQAKSKRCIILSGRIHPGQPCGSYMMKGFLEFICSMDQNAKWLRQKIVFKVVPMLNPDGVTVGNFRTGLCGKDLNRCFRMQNDLLIPEVKGLKDLVIRMKQEYKNKLAIFFDFHGHSVKKNVFLYGPEYQIWQTGYYKTRIFPKLLSDRTQIFRYYSCLFRIAEFKKSTARAVLLKNIPHCYTIQASTGFYYSSQQKKDIPFTIQKYEFMGMSIGQTLKDYLELLYQQQSSRLERKQKQSQIKTLKSNRAKSKRSSQRQKQKFISRKLPTPKQQQQQVKKQPFVYMSIRARQLIQKIKRQDQQQRLKQQGHESDKFSEGGSDSQSGGDDLNQDELNKLHQDIIGTMNQFQQRLGTKNMRNSRQYSFKEQIKKKTNKEPAKIKNIQVMASLRHKVQKTQKNKNKQLVLIPIRQQVKLDRIKRSSTKNDKPGAKKKQDIQPLSMLKAQEQVFHQYHSESPTKFPAGQQQCGNLSKVSKLSLGKFSSSSKAKSRLYSLIQKNHQQQDIVPYSVFDPIHMSIIQDQLSIDSRPTQFQDNMFHKKDLSHTTQDYRKSNTFDKNQIQPNNSLALIKYASQLQGRGINYKLRKVFQQNLDMIQGSNFVKNNGIVVYSTDVTQLTRKKPHEQPISKR